MKKGFLFYLGVLMIEGVSFFMGMGFVLVMYRVVTPLVRWMWAIGFGWVLLMSLFSFFPLRVFFEKVKE